MQEAQTHLPDGFHFFPSFLDQAAQNALVEDIRGVVAQAPLFQPVMPRSGKPLSVKMSNCGPLGWVADINGYRYQDRHPVTGAPWPAMPPRLMNIWQQVADCPAQPEACLINHYGEAAKMGLHQDRDEQTFDAPVVSISLGDTAVFRIGGTKRGGKTLPITLNSGDVIVFGGPARLCYHGISKVYPDSSPLLKGGGRLNLTLRRVTPF